MIEPLESRIAPAVILAVTVGKSGVTITEEAANAGASTLTLSTDANGGLQIAVSDVNTQLRFGTQLGAPGAPLAIPDFTGNVTAKLGEDADVVTVAGSLPGALSLDLGPGVNGVSFTDTTIGGKVTVKAGAGADTITFGGTAVRLLGGASFALGDGVNAMSNGTSSLLYSGGNFDVTTGNGADSLSLGGKDLQVIGKLSFTTGAGADTAKIQLTGQLNVTGAATLKSSGLAGARTDQTLNAASIFIGGALTMEVKAGEAQQQFFGSGPMVVGGAATFTAGAADSFSSVEITATSASASLYLGGNLTATAKGPEAEFSINDFTSGSIAGSATANGFLSAIFEFSGSINGALKATLAGGQGGYFYAGAATVNAAPLFLHAVTVTAKSDGATIGMQTVVGQSAMTFTGSAGSDIFAIDDVIAYGAIKADLGAGDDNFYIETGAIPPHATQINAALTLLGGKGSDTFSLSGNSANIVLNALATILIDGGADADPAPILKANGNYATKLVQKNF